MLRLIIAVAPFLSLNTATDYSKIINKHALGVDPALIVAVIYVESRFRRRAVSGTDDYGLMQLHVSHRTHQMYRGREHLLFNASRNIRLGVRSLKMWRAYHRRRCKGKKHHWINHYNQGTRVWNRRYERRVRKVMRRLKNYI